MGLEPMDLDRPTTGAATKPTEAEQIAQILDGLGGMAEGLDERLYNLLTRMNGANELRGRKELEPTEGFFPSALVLASKIKQGLDGALETMDRLEQLV